MSDKLRHVVWLLGICNQLRAELVSVLVSPQLAAVQCEHTLCLLFQPTHHVLRRAQLFKCCKHCSSCVKPVEWLQELLEGQPRPALIIQALEKIV